MQAAAARGDVDALHAPLATWCPPTSTASPPLRFTPDEQVRRAQQLIRFLDLIPIEYDRGTDDGEVTLDFEIQEADRLQRGGAARPSPTSRPAAGRARPRGRRDRRGRAGRARNDLRRRQRGKRPSRPRTRSTSVSRRGERDSRRDPPRRVKESNAEADFDLIEISLDQMEAAINAGEREQADRRSAQRLRVLRVRPRAAAARPRPPADGGGRGLRLVRRRAASRGSPS